MTLTLHLGPMFAGKSTKAIQIFTEAETHLKVALKPIFDTRDGGYIRDHNGNTIPATFFNTHKDLTKQWGNEIILIDEIQFLPKHLIKVISEMSVYRTVHCFGLDMDWKGNAFSIISKLRERADNIILYHGKCTHCESLSEYSAKLDQIGEICEVGGADKYIPLCKKCFKEHRSGR